MKFIFWLGVVALCLATWAVVGCMFVFILLVYF